MKRIVGLIIILVFISGFLGLLNKSKIADDQVVSPNLIANSSLEIKSSNAQLPMAWKKGGYGTNTRVFTYPVAGQEGMNAAKISISKYKNGDAKWFFDDVIVKPNTSYKLTLYYKSTVTTEVDLRYTLANKKFKYIPLGNPEASVDWAKKEYVFKTPANAKSLTVFHLIAKNGDLIIDNFSLSEIVDGSNPSPTAIASSSPSLAPTPTPVVTLPPTPTPVPTTQPTISPTNAPTVIPTVVPTATPTPLQTSTPTPVVTLAPTLPPTPTPVPTTQPTVSPTNAPTVVPTATILPTEVPSITPDPSSTPTSTPAETTSPTPDVTATPIQTASPTPDATVSPTATPSPSPEPTLLPTASPTASATAIPTFTPSPTPVATPSPSVQPTLSPEPNMILNGSVESASTDGLNPLNWSRGGWGTNIANLSYPAESADGNKGLKVELTGYTDGDAKWWFDEVSVLPNTTYSFTDSYKSNITSDLTIQYRNTSNVLSYVWLATPNVSPEWTTVTYTFTTPSDVSSLTIFHSIAAVGWLVTDNYKLNEVASNKFNQGMLSFNFDDGYLSVYQNAIPMLNNAGMKSTQYIIAETLGGGFSGYVNAAQVISMQAQGHEIGAHSNTHADLTLSSPAELLNEVSGSKNTLENAGVNIISSFAYPYGNYNAAVIQALVSAGYEAGRSAYPDSENYKDTNKYELRVVDVQLLTPVSTVKSWIDQAIANRSWVILMYHQIDNSGDQYSTLPANLQEVINYAKSTGILVVTNKQGVALMN